MPNKARRTRQQKIKTSSSSPKPRKAKKEEQNYEGCPPSKDPELWKSIVDTDKNCRELLDLIPPAVWGFDEHIKLKLKHRKHDLVDSKLTFGERKILKKKDKVKLAQSDPSQLQTITQIWEWLDGSGLVANRPTKPPKPQKKTSNPKPTASPADTPTNATSDGVSEEVALIESTSKLEKTVNNTATPVVKLDLSVGVKEKKQKQQKRKRKESKNDESEEEENEGETKRKRHTVDAKQGKNNHNEKSPDIVPMSSSRAEALVKLQKKLDEMRSKRRGDKTAEDWERERKEKRKLSKMKLREKKKATPKTPDPTTPTTDENKDEVTTQVKGLQNGVKGTGKPHPHMRNQEGKVVFTKFDLALSPAARFALKDEERKKKSKEKKLKGQDLHGRDYKRLLEKVEKQKKLISSLEETDKDKADKLKSQLKWDAALLRSQGVKVKDNADLLKKAMKRKESVKEHSKKKWEQRNAHVAHKQNQRQEKRQTNIQKRIDQKKKKQKDNPKRNKR